MRVRRRRADDARAHSIARGGAGHERHPAGRVAADAVAAGGERIDDELDDVLADVAHAGRHHRAAPRSAEREIGPAIAHRDLDRAGRADVRDELADRDVLVGALHRERDPLDGHARAGLMRREVRDQVAEAVDVHDAATAARPGAPRQRAGQRTVEATGALAQGELCGRAREHVAAVERRADRCIARPRGDVPGPDLPRDGLCEVGEHAVVGADVPVAAGRRDHTAARTADAGIDDDHMHRAGRELAARGRDDPRAMRDVVTRHVVRDRGDRRGRCEPRDHAGHRAGVAVTRAEVGDEGDPHAPTSLSPRRPRVRGASIVVTPCRAR